MKLSSKVFLGGVATAVLFTGWIGIPVMAAGVYLHGYGK